MNHQGGEITIGQAALAGLASLEGAILMKREFPLILAFCMNLGKEPWIIVMDKAFPLQNP